VNDAAAPRIDPAQAQHPGRRESQQDACGFLAPADAATAAHAGHLAVLADGMGGMPQRAVGRRARRCSAFIDRPTSSKAADEDRARGAAACHAAPPTPWCTTKRSG
jgi:hypothetical protein